MAATKRIKRALVSVYHKDGLDEILKNPKIKPTNKTHNHIIKEKS